jgi:hypothetical protein
MTAIKILHGDVEVWTTPQFIWRLVMLNVRESSVSGAPDPALGLIGQYDPTTDKQKYPIWTPYSIPTLSVSPFSGVYDLTPPITMAAQSEAGTVFARSNAGIVGSNPTQGMGVGVRLFCVCVVLCVVAALRRDDHPSKESYRLCIGLRNWKIGQSQTKGCRAIER